MSLSDKYAKFDAIDYDAEDEEEKQAKAAEEAKRKKASNEAREKAAEARAKAAGLNGGSPLGVPPAPTKAAGAAGPNTMMEAGSALQRCSASARPAHKEGPRQRERGLHRERDVVRRPLVVQQVVK